MKRNIFCLILIFTLISSTLLLTGCTEKSPLDADNPVTLTMWHNFGGDMQETIDSLIDEFNSTVGKDQGIIINVTAISSSAELQDKLNMIANGDPGAPEMPDIFTAYPKTAITFVEEDKLVNFDDYLTSKDLDQYVSPFVEEGRFSNGLYVFPFAKSTEIMYLNQTIFDKFSKDTGITYNDLATVEGIIKASNEYYKWSNGKTFFSADSWCNFIQSAVIQQDGEFFKDEKINTSSKEYKNILSLLNTGIKNGGIAIYDGYSSDLSKTGDLVCSTGSTAGILFYGDTITYKDNTVEKVEYDILPYPVIKKGSKVAIQRGNGMCIAKSTEAKELGAVEFIKWFTNSKQNMKFISKTGYLPVTKDAFDTKMETEIATIKDPKIKKMLEAATEMYSNYTFYVPPTFTNVDKVTSDFERTTKANFKKLAPGGIN